jgi:uncharacterized protein YbjT (DUF2867 family)
MMMKKVLVTGATGKIGSQLVSQLAELDDVHVRAFVRNEEKAAALEEAGIEPVIGCFEEEKTVRQAVHDIDTMVLITSPNPNAAHQASTTISLAKRAGVQKIVRVSATKPAHNGPTDNTRQHYQTENEIKASGLTYLILRPNFFMQNILMSAEDIADNGTMHWGVGDGKIGMIDVRDVVDCVEQSVLSEQFDNQTLTLTGPESISFHTVADILTKTLGMPVQYVPITPAAVEQSIRDGGMGDWFAKVMRDYSKAFSENWGDFTTDNVKEITGNRARSFKTFTREVFAP